MAEGNLQNVINKMIDSIKKKNIDDDLSSPEQAQIRAVNSNDTQMLKYYTTKGRILEDKQMLNKFLGISIQQAKKNKDMILHKYFNQEN